MKDTEKGTANREAAMKLTAVKRVEKKLKTAKYAGAIHVFSKSSLNEIKRVAKWADVEIVVGGSDGLWTVSLADPETFTLPL